MKGALERREDFRHWLDIPTRWMDNDGYGHVNNVEYYSFFDTVIGQYLISAGGLDPASSPVIGYAVETHCQFHAALTFPQVAQAGLRVARLGTTSARYEIGIFAAGSETPAATGHFVHVFVDRVTERPTRMPTRIRAGLERLLVGHAPTTP